MIRASNQLAPKTKVVDLLFLYNFYFGQISCSHMKFGVLGGQILDKINSNKVNPRLLCSSVFPVRAHAATGDAPATTRVDRRGDPRPPPPPPLLEPVHAIFPGRIGPAPRPPLLLRAEAQPSRRRASSALPWSD